MRFTPGALILMLLAFSLSPVHGENLRLLSFVLGAQVVFSHFNFFSNQIMRGSVNEVGETAQLLLDF